MLECVFTLDYEIYGNGQGSLRELIYEPTERLMAIFGKWAARFVTFVEVAELEAFEAQGSDDALPLIKDQLRALRRGGFELGLHLHPQWARARREGGQWRLDYSEYSLCSLSRERVIQIVDPALAYLRAALDEPHFSPVSFRAGNWLFQPTRTVAEVLRERGIRIDSSVFKGGRQRQDGLDYRPALKNGYFWRFSDDVNAVDPDGAMWEYPIYTRMVPTWKLFTAKRRSMSRNALAPSAGARRRLTRLRDFLRPRSPLKLDFCRLTLGEMTGLMDGILKEDRKSPGVLKSIVAIGHTKDLRDGDAVDAFLSYLRSREIAVTTFEALLRRSG
jgi:hypothetical protein